MYILYSLYFIILFLIIFSLLVFTVGAFLENIKMSSSLSKILETWINILKRNSQIIKNEKCYEISTIYECVEKLSMTIGCNIWMICLELNRFFYDLSWMLQHPGFIWTQRSLASGVFNKFLLIDATDKSRIRRDHAR